ncbi:MAG: NAD-dependent epimerase/dehydratase family protein [Dehalococcoidia bacterium]
MARALVTGGAGFIGSNLTPELLKLGHSVLVFDDISTGQLENIPDSPDISLTRGDIRDYSQVLAAVAGADVVFHMAAQVGNVLSLQQPDLDLITNASGTINLLRACREQGVNRVILSSSSAIFGETQYVPMDENHPKDPVSPYGLSKLAAEKYCLILGQEYELSVCCLRYFNVYGVNQYFNPYGNVLPIFVERALEGQSLTIYGDGNQTRDFIDVKDIVRANLLAMESGAQGAFNIGTGIATTVNELTKHLLDAFDYPIEVVYAPPRAGEVLHSLADISKARHEMSFSPTVSVEQGVKTYVNWFKERRAQASKQ